LVVGLFEPLFCNLSVYNLKTKEKLCESFHFTINTENVEYIEDFPKIYKLNRSKRRVIFSIPSDIDLGQVFLVLWVDKILQNTDIYQKTKLQAIKSENEKIKEQFKILEKFRTPLMWSFEPLFEEKTTEEGTQFVLRDGEFAFNDLMVVYGDAKSDKKSR
jgi:hypothetical protein